MVKPYVRGVKIPYVLGFINPWFIDHSRYISEAICIRGVFFIFYVIFI